MKRIERHLGGILVKNGALTEEHLNDALDEQKRTKAFLGEILLKRHYIKENDLVIALSEKFDIPVVSIKDKYIDWSFVGAFSPTLILEHKCLPLEKKGLSITIAITNPLDVWALKKAEEESGILKVKFVLVSSEEMESAIERYRQYVQGHS